LALFRIVQEALHNVAKHAQPSEVTVDVTFEEDILRVSVQDNCKGLGSSPSMGDLVASGKLGLTGMYERAQLVGARLDLRSHPGEGTAVTATLDL
jgi:signal transduction histidine kinase